MAMEDIVSSVQLCATAEHHRRLVATNLGYKSRRQSIEQFNLALRGRRSLRAGVAHIPVVVHVVYNSAVQNIGDAQVDSQIAVLNADFNATNADVNTVPPVFKPLVGTAGITFFRAKRDPQGNPTTGITRTRTALTSFDPRDDRMKFTAQGGADAWPSDRYLNIWVCQISDDILGFATFPGAPPEIDGVVIKNTFFGTVGTASAPYNLGRTTTHEIGHWLNVFHIWGDDELSCSGTDHCDDTPNQGGFNERIPQFPRISCNNGPNGDLFMNYMDYTYDKCCVMFTKGQVHRMNAALSGPRSSFVGSNFVELILQTGTALPNTDDKYEFVMTDWNGDGRPDLVAIQKSGTGTSNTEIHILSGASKFQEVLLHTGTALPDTDDKYEFVMTDWNGDGLPDLVAIQKSGTGTSNTEIHILSGASKFQDVLLHTGSALHNTDDTFKFAMTDWNGDGRPDLIAIKKSNTVTNSTEVHILAG